MFYHTCHFKMLLKKHILSSFKKDEKKLVWGMSRKLPRGVLGVRILAALGLREIFSNLVSQLMCKPAIA